MELSFLEHGAFTFTFLNPGNKYIKKGELSRAIEENDYKIIAKCLQGMVGSVANSVAFLTQGKQHTIDCIRGHHFDIGHGGSFSLYDIEGEITREILVAQFEKARKII